MSTCSPTTQPRTNDSAGNVQINSNKSFKIRKKKPRALMFESASCGRPQLSRESLKSTQALAASQLVQHLQRHFSLLGGDCRTVGIPRCQGVGTIDPGRIFETWQDVKSMDLVIETCRNSLNWNVGKPFRFSFAFRTLLCSLRGGIPAILWQKPFKIYWVELQH